MNSWETSSTVLQSTQRSLDPRPFIRSKKGLWCLEIFSLTVVRLVFTEILLRSNGRIHSSGGGTYRPTPSPSDRRQNRGTRTRKSGISTPRFLGGGSRETNPSSERLETPELRLPLKKGDAFVLGVLGSTPLLSTSGLSFFCVKTTLDQVYREPMSGSLY